MVDDFPHMVSNVQVTLLANAGAFTRPANHHDLEIGERDCAGDGGAWVWWSCSMKA